MACIMMHVGSDSVMIPVLTLDCWNIYNESPKPTLKPFKSTPKRFLSTTRRRHRSLLTLPQTRRRVAVLLDRDDSLLKISAPVVLTSKVDWNPGYADVRNRDPFFGRWVRSHSHEPPVMQKRASISCGTCKQADPPTRCAAVRTGSKVDRMRRLC